MFKQLEKYLGWHITSHCSVHNENERKWKHWLSSGYQISSENLCWHWRLTIELLVPNNKEHFPAAIKLKMKDEFCNLLFCFISHTFPHRGAINDTLKTDKKQIDFFHSVLTAIRTGLFLGMFQPVSKRKRNERQTMGLSKIIKGFPAINKKWVA